MSYNLKHPFLWEKCVYCPTDIEFYLDLFKNVINDPAGMAQLLDCPPIKQKITSFWLGIPG